MDTPIAIIGAGLAGLTTAIRLQQLGFNPVLINSCILDAQGKVGGFASFSGAKFSLPPAGLGLISITKTEDALWNAIENVLEVFGLDLNGHAISHDKYAVLSTLRNYKSLVLMPNEINDLIQKLKNKLDDSGINIIHGYCHKIEFDSGAIVIHIKDEKYPIYMHCKTAFFAGGRLGANILLDAGIEPTDNKGIDVGVRIEFKDHKGLSSLRKHGPDAKIMALPDFVG